MKRRASCILIAIVVLLSACGKSTPETSEPKGMVYYTYFDTVSYVYSYANDSAERFESLSADVSHILKEYHELFDIYHEYEGINNLCTLNKNAGVAPVEIDGRLVKFLNEAIELYDATNGEMNVMIGAVTALWHDAREDGTYVPDRETLEEASHHTDIGLLEVGDGTAFISDPLASIDVGAFAKGYATEMAAEYLEEAGAESYVLNIGGNIRIIGEKPDGTGWKTAIKDPLDPYNSFAGTLRISDISCVTSGIYERYYTVDGIRYHHIIDMDTLMPSEYFASVTILHKDSGVADALSTALFCMSEEEGKEVAERFGAQVLWIYPDGTQSMTPGMGEYIEET